MSAVGNAFEKHPVSLSIVGIFALAVALAGIGDVVNATHGKTSNDMTCTVQQTDQGSTLSAGSKITLSCTPR